MLVGKLMSEPGSKPAAIVMTTIVLKKFKMKRLTQADNGIWWSDNPRGAELIIRFGPHMTTLRGNINNSKKWEKLKQEKTCPTNRVEYTRNSMVFFRISMFWLRAEEWEMRFVTWTTCDCLTLSLCPGRLAVSGAAAVLCFVVVLFFWLMFVLNSEIRASWQKLRGEICCPNCE